MTAGSRRLFALGITAAAVWALDWGVKAAHPASGSAWLPHYADHSPLAIPAAALLLVVLVRIVRSTFVAVAAGMAFGGLCANLVDLALHGYVWDMLPTPFGWTCNVADFSLILGSAATVVGVLVYFSTVGGPLTEREGTG